MGWGELGRGWEGRRRAGWGWDDGQRLVVFVVSIFFYNLSIHLLYL